MLVVNFELANGGTFGLSLAKDSFDEGVDLDTIMVGLQLALFIFGVTGLPRRGRQESNATCAGASAPPLRPWKRSSGSSDARLAR